MKAADGRSNRRWPPKYICFKIIFKIQLHLLLLSIYKFLVKGLKQNIKKINRTITLILHLDYLLQSVPFVVCSLILPVEPNHMFTNPHNWCLDYVFRCSQLTFHAACLQCIFCRQVLQKDDRYFCIDGSIICQHDYNLIYINRHFSQTGLFLTELKIKEIYELCFRINSTH